MPLYPYHCTQCGHKFEKIQSFKAKPETKCPKCGGPLERVLTAPGLSFKGAGWYVNDYAPKSSSSTTDTAPADKKTEAKPKTEAASSESSASSSQSTASSSPAPATPATKPTSTTS